MNAKTLISLIVLFSIGFVSLLQAQSMPGHYQESLISNDRQSSTSTDYIKTQYSDSLAKVAAEQDATTDTAYAFKKKMQKTLLYISTSAGLLIFMIPAKRFFSIPGNTLFAFMLQSIKAHQLTAYKNEKFNSTMSYLQVMKFLADSVVDQNISSSGSNAVSKDFNPASIYKYEIKADFYFDRVKREIISHVVGLAPIATFKTVGGDHVSNIHPFWLYGPQLNRCIRMGQAGN